VETKAHLCFFKKWWGGRCGCVYGAKGAVDRKCLGTTALQLRLVITQRASCICEVWGSRIAVDEDSSLRSRYACLLVFTEILRDCSPKNALI
jgi:hypothetical protein